MLIFKPKIEKIRFKNFFNFRKEEEFRFFDISNPNRNVSLISGFNGAGKSVISSEAIYFALFNQSLRSNKLEDVINFQALEEKDPGFVELSIIFKPENIKNKDSNYPFYIRLKIFREIAPQKIKRKTNIDVSLLINEKEISENIFEYCASSEIKDKISDEDYKTLIHFLKRVISLTDNMRIHDINTSIERIVNINKDIFLKINLHSPFSDTPIPQGRNILSDNILSSVFPEVKYLDIFNQFLREKEKELKVEFESAKDKIKVLENIIDKAKNKQSEEEDKDFDKLIQDIEAAKNKIKQQLNKLELKIQEAQNKILEIEKLKVRIKEEISKKNQEVLDLNKTLGEFTVRVKDLEKQLNTFKKLKRNPSCPICKQSLTEEYLDKLTQEYSDKLEKAKSDLESILKMKKSKEKEYNELNEKLKKVEIKITQFGEVKYKLEKQKHEFEKTLINYTQKINFLKEKKDDNKNNNNKTQEIITYTLKEIEEHKNSLKNLKEEEVKIAYLKQIFDKNSEAVNYYFYTKIKELNDIFSNFLIYFTDKFTSALEIENGKVKFSINKMNYNNFSTSEKKRINIAFAFAIFFYALKFNKTFPIIILDEFFDNMDLDIISQVYSKIYEIANQLGIQIIITTNMMHILGEYINEEDLNTINLYTLS